ncbi:MAG: hypothetical protein FGM57_01915 [Candidatus Taylorbacteria bacterium]|nr:hypothetical protein [Candidatus Taylorbacteria bacterium]
MTTAKVIIAGTILICLQIVWFLQELQHHVTTNAILELSGFMGKPMIGQTIAPFFKVVCFITIPYSIWRISQVLMLEKDEPEHTANSFFFELAAVFLFFLAMHDLCYGFSGKVFTPLTFGPARLILTLIVWVVAYRLLEESQQEMGRSIQKRIDRTRMVF